MNGFRLVCTGFALAAVSATSIALAAPSSADSTPDPATYGPYKSLSQCDSARDGLLDSLSSKAGDLVGNCYVPDSSVSWYFDQVLPRDAAASGATVCDPQQIQIRSSSGDVRCG